MSKNNNKTIAEQALVDVDKLTASLKEESKSTIANLLEEAVKDYMRDSIDGDDEDDDMEIQDGEQDSAENDLSNDESDSEEDVSVEDAADDEEDTESDSESDEGEDTNDDNAIEIDAQSEGEDEDGDEWSEFDKFKVDDNTYDLTGEDDYDSVVKVYKLLKDDDNVIVKKDGDKITLKDEGNDAEYVIDLGTDSDEDECEDGMCGMDESCCAKNENRKNRKTMNENKEIILEVDLGYTDNYQKKDPIEGLSMSEPGKGTNLDKGIPTGTEKPWAGKKVKSVGAPYGDKTINEEEEPLTDITNGEELEEATNVGGCVQERSASKTNAPSGKVDYMPYGSRHISAAGDYKEVKLAESILAKSEAILKENKELKKTLVKVKSALQEALMVNVNLGKVTKLFLENTTTQNEKVDIINRFNEAKTIDQSNALYESIRRELNGAKQNVVLENSMNAKGSVINENKIYESQDLLNIRDFMKRMNNC